MTQTIVGVSVFRHLELLQREMDPQRRSARKMFAHGVMYGSNCSMDAKVFLPSAFVEQSDLDGSKLPLANGHPSEWMR